MRAQPQATPPTEPASPEPQPTTPQQPSSYSPPTPTSTKYNASPNQMNTPSPNKSFGPKDLLIKVTVALIVVGGIFTALVLTGTIAFNEFKTVNYISATGGHYSFDFYTKHTTETLKSGSTALVSKVSKNNKPPIKLSISTGSASEINKNGLKNCTSPVSKLFDIQNRNLNQTISVCSVLLQGGGPSGVYLAGILNNDQTSIITFSQDLSNIDLSRRL